MSYDIADVLLHGSDDEIYDFAEESAEFIFVDWREDKRDIIKYFNALIEEDLTGEPDGSDLQIQFEGKQAHVGLRNDPSDIYRTIRCIRDLVASRYEIRVYGESLDGDTHTFYVKSNAWWRWADGQYPDQMQQIFVKLTDDLDFE